MGPTLATEASWVLSFCFHSPKIFSFTHPTVVYKPLLFPLFPHSLQNPPSNYIIFHQAQILKLSLISLQMSGVWVFKDGVVRCIGNNGADGGESSGNASNKRKVLVHVPTNETVTSYDVLERKLAPLGWERYLNDPDLLQFHQRSSVHLISLPRDFSRLRLVHMYDIVVKTRNVFEVRDAWTR